MSCCFGSAANITACNFTSNVSPWAGGALQVRDNAHVLVSASVFANNTSLKTDVSHQHSGAGGAISIHSNATGENF